MRMLVAIVLALTFVQCSKVDFGIRYMEYTTEKEINALFDFNRAKKKTVQTEFEEFARAFKKKIFPVLSQQIRSFGENPDVIVLFKAVKGDRDLLKPDAIHFADKLLLLVGPEESAALRLNYGKKIAETQEKLDDMTDTRKKEKQKIVRAVEFFFDSLTKAQEDKVNEFIAKTNFPYALQVKSQERSLSLFNETHGESEKLKLLSHRFIDEPKTVELPEFVEAREAYFVKLADLVSSLVATASPEQMVSLKKAAANLAADLQRLSEEAH